MDKYQQLSDAAFASRTARLIVAGKIRSMIRLLLRGHRSAARLLRLTSKFGCGNLTEEHFLKMKNSIDDLIDQGEDSVRYYFLCRGCVRKIEYSGIGRLPDTEVFRVV